VIRENLLRQHASIGIGLFGGGDVGRRDKALTLGKKAILWGCLHADEGWVKSQSLGLRGEERVHP